MCTSTHAPRYIQRSRSTAAATRSCSGQAPRTPPANRHRSFPLFKLKKSGKVAPMKRIFNFSPGPATLPLPVLEEASRGVLEIGGSGMSILEVSHRGKEYEAIHFDARD